MALSEPSAAGVATPWRIWAPGAEQRLIAAAVAGDRQAFDELAEPYRGELCAFLRKRLGDAELDDLVQETWIAAWGSIRSFDRRSRFRTWLFSIALNKCRDHYRSRSAEARRVVATDSSSSEGSYDEGGYRAAELTDLIRTVLAELPHTHREVLSLYYYEGLNLPEVAERLGRNLNTVKYQFYRAHDEAARRLEPVLGMKPDSSGLAKERSA